MVAPASASLINLTIPMVVGPLRDAMRIVVGSAVASTPAEVVLEDDAGAADVVSGAGAVAVQPAASAIVMSAAARRMVRSMGPPRGSQDPAPLPGRDLWANSTVGDGPRRGPSDPWSGVPPSCSCS